MFTFNSNHRGEDGHDHRHSDDHDHRHARGDFWHGLMHGHGFGHRHGGRLGRLFEHGDLRLVILHLIAEKPRHGYEIIKAIEEMAGGTYSPSPGTIYPALTLLEEQGLVTVAPSEGGKKLHAITGDGRADLDANRNVVAALLARMAHVGESQGGEPSPQIVRAAENLKLALRLRLSRGPLSGEQAQAVSAALDRAAREIEEI